MYFRSKQPKKIHDVGIRALKYANGKTEISSELITESNNGLPSYEPKLCDEGTGGTYFLKTANNKNIAVFKPKDEDPLSANNPKQQVVSGFSGLKAGDGIYREVLAHVIDPTIVPKTLIAELKHPMFTSSKVGSLQEFVQNAEPSEEYGSSLFSVEDVHKIALLDIRIVNCDRNGENILVKRNKNNNSYSLIPIDHAFSLPAYTAFDSLKHFEWMNYRQSKAPISQEMKNFILNIDIEKDLQKAKAIGIQREALITMKIAHIVLTRGVSANKTFFEIGKLLCSKSFHDICKRDYTNPNQVIDEVQNYVNSMFF